MLIEATGLKSKPGHILKLNRALLPPAAASACPVDGEPACPASGPPATRSEVFPQPDDLQAGRLVGAAGLSVVEAAPEAAQSAEAETPAMGQVTPQQAPAGTATEASKLCLASKTEPMQISERKEVTTAAGSHAEPCVANVLQGNLESAEYSPEYSDADSEQYSDAESSGSDDPQEDAEVAQRVEETRGQISRPSKVRRLIGSKLTEVRHRWSPLFGFAA